MPIQIFIDGSAGTTGLRIVQRLAERAKTEPLTVRMLEGEQRKDLAARIGRHQPQRRRFPLPAGRRPRARSCRTSTRPCACWIPPRRTAPPPAGSTACRSCTARAPR